MVKVKRYIDIKEIKMGAMQPGRYYILDFKREIVQDICYMSIDEIVAIYREHGKGVFVEVEEMKEDD